MKEKTVGEEENEYDKKAAMSAKQNLVAKFCQSVKDKCGDLWKHRSLYFFVKNFVIWFTNRV